MPLYCMVKDQEYLYFSFEKHGGQGLSSIVSTFRFNQNSKYRESQFLISNSFRKDSLESRGIFA